MAARVLRILLIAVVVVGMTAPAAATQTGARVEDEVSTQRLIIAGKRNLDGTIVRRPAVLTTRERTTSAVTQTTTSLAGQTGDAVWSAAVQR